MRHRSVVLLLPALGLCFAAPHAEVARMRPVEPPAPFATTTVSNTTIISLPGHGITASEIVVPAGLGSLQNITVTLHQLNEPIPSQLQLLLSGPRGQSINLSSFVGGSSSVSNLTVSFDDLGDPFPGLLVSGTYRPEALLATFNGPDPGGVWRLTCAKAISGQGQITNGWSVTLTTSAFPGTFVFTDATLTAGATRVKTAHLTELRTAVNAIRVRNGLTPATFTDATPTIIKGVHMTELRTALGAVFTAFSRVAPVYTDPTISANATVIRASHFEELRSAIREADAMMLTVTKAGSGSGTVTSNPSGILCGADCAEAYSPDRVVTLTATPASGSIFGGWSGACSGTDPCQLTMNAAKPVTATFTVAPLTLTVVKAGAGTGTIISSPVGISCGSTCSQSYTNGSVVTLYPNPATGSTFTGWSGVCTGTGTCEITMSASTQVTATFAGYTAATYDVQPGNGYLGPAGGCNGGVIGQQFTITAPAGVNWTADWTGADLPPSSHAGGLNKSSGTGSDTAIFTITIASQSPGPGRTCANINTYDFTDTFFFRFYSGGLKVSEVVVYVRWKYRLVS